MFYSEMNLMMKYLEMFSSLSFVDVTEPIALWGTVYIMSVVSVHRKLNWYEPVF